MNDPRILVIGASMGGIRVFPPLISQLRPKTPVATFVVQHLYAGHKTLLPAILAKHTTAPVKLAEDEEPIRTGQVYVCPPDQHLVVREGVVRLGFGPPENNSRPSVDVLFRSAAEAYRHRVVGVLLTGLLADGAKGMKAIRECGGTTLVQDPDDAEFDEMPRNTLKTTAVDHVVPIGEMPLLLTRLLEAPLPPPTLAPDAPALRMLQRRVMASLRPAPAMNVRRSSAELIDSSALPVTLDDSLWAVLQYMQERTTMLENLAEEQRLKERSRLAESYALRARESRLHTENLRTYVIELEMDRTPLTLKDAPEASE